jgi:hypothetical protein
MINPRQLVGSPPALLAIVCIFLTLVSPWMVGISQVHTDVNFGFQNPICWLVVLSILAALAITDPNRRLAAALAAQAFLVTWFAWMMWVATTPQYSSVDFTFVGVDLVGAGWFQAALGVIAVGAIIARQFHEQELPPGKEVWLLSAIPGIGLVRLGRTARGLIWTTLVAAALFLASFDTPIAPSFQPITGHFDLPPAPPTRAPDWILLAAALALTAASVVDTLAVKRRLAIVEP